MSAHVGLAVVGADRAVLRELHVIRVPAAAHVPALAEPRTVQGLRCPDTEALTCCQAG